MRVVFSWIFVCLMLIACASVPVEEEQELVSLDKHFVYTLPPTGHVWREAIAEAVSLLPGTQGFVSAVPYNSNRLQMYPDGKLFLWGTPQSHGLIGRILSSMDIEMNPQGFLYGQELYPVVGSYLRMELETEGRRVEIGTGVDHQWLLNREDEERPLSLGDLEVWNLRGEVVITAQLVKNGDSWTLENLQYNEPILFMEARVREIGSQYLSDNYKLEFQYQEEAFLQLAKGKKLLFLGETHDHEPTIVQELAISEALLETGNYDVLAIESLYSLWPILESLSVRKEDIETDLENLEMARGQEWVKGFSGDRFLELIRSFNQGRDSNERVILSSFDLDHAINHSKQITRDYLNFLTDKSNSASFRLRAREITQSLLQLQEKEGILDWLAELHSVIMQETGSFTPEDLEELLFSLELAEASIQYQLHHEPPTLDAPAGGIRGRYFRETMIRALEKSDPEKGLIAIVGSLHAHYRDRGADDHIMPRYPEAYFFSRFWELDQNEVASIDLIPMGSFDLLGDPGTFLIREIGLPKERALLLLGEMPTQLGLELFPSWFTDEGPVVDAVVLIP